MREAGNVWAQRDMRATIHREVALVRKEAAAGRLGWNFADIRSLILKYPPRKAYDDVLQRIHAEDRVEAADMVCDDEGWVESGGRKEANCCIRGEGSQSAAAPRLAGLVCFALH